MDVGQTERSQIIQLFGRGVRFKGHGSSLKRSGKPAMEARNILFQEDDMPGQDDAEAK